MASLHYHPINALVSNYISGNEEPCNTQRSTQTRGVTSMKKIRDSRKPCTVQACPNTGWPIGAHSPKYANWVGQEARTKISILESDWRYVDIDEKARFWVAIKVNNTLYVIGFVII